MASYTRSGRAEKDLKEIWRYIANNSSLRQADKFLDKLQAFMQKLADSPGMGTRRDYLEPGLFGAAKDKYLIFYQKTDDGIRIIRVIHGSRDIDAQFD